VAGMTPTPAAEDAVEGAARSRKDTRGDPNEACEARRVRGVGTPGSRMSMAAVWRMQWAGVTRSSSVEDERNSGSSILCGLRD
jgi:hypothetical protein